jgi:hypothetical protein
MAQAVRCDAQVLLGDADFFAQVIKPVQVDLDGLSRARAHQTARIALGNDFAPLEDVALRSVLEGDDARAPTLCPSRDVERVPTVCRERFEHDRFADTQAVDEDEAQLQACDFASAHPCQ